MMQSCQSLRVDDAYLSFTTHTYLAQASIQTKVEFANTEAAIASVSQRFGLIQYAL
jgi:hypothetical protein